MGEQTQTQTQLNSDTPPSQSPRTEPPQTSDISQNPPNPSKIPIRPPKIRKLSSIPTPQPPSSSETTTIVSTSTSKPRRRNPPKPSTTPLPQIIKPLSSSGEIDAALRHLLSTDPLLATLISTYPPPTFESHQPPFLALSKSILYQQLAYKAGTSIYTRFVSLCGGQHLVLPETVLSLSILQLKQIGVSSRKASYLYDLASKFKNGILSDDTVVKMDDRSLFTMLSMVKGIGSWSVHMFMIFSLHRPDVLPVSDLGVRKGVQMLYGLDELPRPSQMEQICEKWRPYRSVGAWYMWRFVEGKGTPTAGGSVSLEGRSVMPLQQLGPEDEGQQQQHQLQHLEPIHGVGNLGW